MTYAYRLSSQSDPKPVQIHSVLTGIKSKQAVTCKNLLERCRNRGDRISSMSVRRAMRKACDDGLLEKISDKKWYEDMPTVAEWRKTLSLTKFKHGGGGKNGTRYGYARNLEKFNAWLHEKKFDVNTYDKDENIVKIRIEFKNVEEMVAYLEGSVDRSRHVSRIIKSYLCDDIHNHKKAATIKMIKNSILSYFEYNDFSLNLRFDPKKIYNAEMSERIITLSDMAKILYSANVRDRAIILCMFHRGLDSSTMADGFNYDAFGQIVQCFGTADHSKWDLGKCPVPIRLLRIKTKYMHTGFLEKDAIRALCVYLDERRAKTGRDMTPDEPLFNTKYGKPVNTNALRNTFERASGNAGVRIKIGKTFIMSQHEMRDLLKSTLINSGCRYDIADHAIGHKPKDSYEKQTILYPETMRTEYAKAAREINILERSGNAIDAFRQQDGTRLRAIEGQAEETEYCTYLEKQGGSKKDENMPAAGAEKNPMEGQNGNREMRKNIEDLEKKIDILQKTIEKITESGDSRHGLDVPMPAMYSIERA